MSQDSPEQQGLSEEQNGPQSRAASRLHEIKTGATWFLVLGIVLIVVGMFAVGSSFVATMATVMAFGILLLIGGGMQVAGSLACRRWSGFFMHLLEGILYLVVGLLMLNQPAEAAAVLTILLAVMLLVGGAFRVVVSLSEQFQSWGWVFVNGVITFVLGLLIAMQWPVSGLWVIGLFVGIELIFTGWTWVMLGTSVRTVARRGEQSVTDAQ